MDVTRILKNFGSRARLDDLAAVHDEDAIANLGTWPYIEAKVDVQPGLAVYAEAFTRTARRYEAVKTPWTAYDPPELLARIKSALAEGLPVVFAMPVGRALLGLAGPIERHRYPPLNTFGNDYIGNHAMAIVGSDDALGACIAENSWGANWGDRGYWALSYGSLGELMEAWVLREFAGVDVPAPPGIYLTDISRFNVSARIVPRPEESGQPPNVWVGASWRGQIYLQRPDHTWQPFDGTYAPVATVVMDGPFDFDALPLNIRFDLASFTGADVYVAYGRDTASWRMERICTVPAY